MFCRPYWLFYISIFYLEVQRIGICEIYSDIYSLSSDVEEEGNKSQEKKGKKFGLGYFIRERRRDLKGFFPIARQP
jgi:hypothetical protein